MGYEFGFKKGGILLPNQPDRPTTQQLMNQIRRIMTAVNQIDGTYYLAAKKMGVNENELALLYAIGDGQLHSQKEVSEQWLIPRTTINTIVKKYQEKGLLTLHNIEGQRREMHLCLTDAGKEYCAELLQPIYAAETAALAKTLENCSDCFIDGFAVFSQLLEQQFTQTILAPPGKDETNHEN